MATTRALHLIRNDHTGRADVAEISDNVVESPRPSGIISGEFFRSASTRYPSLGPLNLGEK